MVLDTGRREFALALQNPQLLNTHSYVGNNPLKYVDGEGEFLGILVGLAGAALAAPLATELVAWGFIALGFATYHQASSLGYHFEGQHELGDEHANMAVMSSLGYAEIGADIMWRDACMNEADNTQRKSARNDNAANRAALSQQEIKRQSGNLLGKKVNGVEIPKNWIRVKADTEGGFIYRDPANPDYNHIRVMPGDPNSSYPAQQVPYIKIHTPGQAYIDLNGNPVPYNSAESHIPIVEITD